MIAEGELFAVAVATRDRPATVMRLLDALEAQTFRDFRTVIVDQSDPPDRALQSRVDGSDRIRLIKDDGRGLARARNLGWQNIGARWIAVLDDDTFPAPDWAAELRRELEAHPDVDMVSGPVLADAPAGVAVSDYPLLGAFPVTEPRVVAGRWTRPWRVAGTGAYTIRRAAIERLGGWDERFGAGTPDFPACEDSDFTYRLTRGGGRVYLTPEVRISHEQWRSAQAAVNVYAGYNRAWGGLIVKQLKTGDPAGAALLAAARLRGIWRITRKGLATRSSLPLRRARAELGGFLRGTALGLRRSW